MLAQLPCGHPSVPWRVCDTPEPPICRCDEVPEQPSEHSLGASKEKYQIIYPEVLQTLKWSPSEGQLENVSPTI